ncbi:Serine/threonine protein kinase [Planctomycetales bacterium 10988]|nr:Serine/threonine protein kinase [Planctomycetales bacterium 10988]
MAEYIGSYRVLRVLTSGQTSQICAVIHNQSVQRFAIKRLLPAWRKDRSQVAALKKEYKIASSLQHPGVLNMFEFDYHDGYPYFVMELFTAPTFKEILVHSSVTELSARIQPLLIQAAEALNHLHDQGWVHRDIKSENYLCNDQERVKLIDFGISIAKPKGIFKFFGGKTKPQGTRNYMSPEQIRGDSLDERADIYSFGCMMFEMLTGNFPYNASDPQAILRCHLKDPVPILRSSEIVFSKELEKLVYRMLQKKREARPKSMQEVLNYLRGIPFYRERV